MSVRSRRARADARASDLASAIDRAHALDLDLASHLARAFDVLDRQVLRAQTSLAQFRVLLSKAGDADSPAPAAGLSRPVKRVVACAVAVLPAQWQARYDEEWRAELGELTGRDRFRCSVRLLGRAWSMRRALHGRSAGEPASRTVLW